MNRRKFLATGAVLALSCLMLQAVTPRRLVSVLNRPVSQPVQAVVQFSPTNIADLALWVSADYGVYTDVEMTTPVSANGDRVKAWVDRSGNGKNLTMATDGKRPTYTTGYLNGKPCLTLNSANAECLSSAAFTPWESYTILAVCSSDSVTTRGYIYGVASGTSANTISALLYYNIQNSGGEGAVGYTYGNGSSGYTSGQMTNYYRSTGNRLVAATNYIISQIRVDGRATNSINVNGSDYSTLITYGNISDVSGANHVISVGRRGTYDFFPWSGKISELIVYSSGEVTGLSNVIDYLADKYSIPLDSVVENAVTYQTIPTPDETGQGVHPSVYYSSTGWNGYKYWMAFTPYAGADDALENPCIVASNDGNTWVVPDGLTNPIEAKPAGAGYNADTELMFGQDGKLYCYFQQAINDHVSTYVYVKSSTDGVIWSDKALVYQAVYGKFQSPSVFWDGSQYVMYYNNASGSPFKISKLTCATPDGTFANSSDCTIKLLGRSANETTWHIYARKASNGIYYALLTTRHLNTPDTEYVEFLRSHDGTTFWADTKTTLKPRSGEWDETCIYRACFIETSTGFDVWYSAMGGAQVWRIGRTPLYLPNK